LAAPRLQSAETPVTPDASSRTRALLAYFGDIYGKRMLSGQQDSAVWKDQPQWEFEYIQKTTGKLPAIRAFEMAPYTRGSAPVKRQSESVVIERAKHWYLESNGIVTLCWHWHAPTGPGDIYVTNTPYDYRAALAEGSPEHGAVLRDLDLIAAQLKRLRDADVPVLWRPLHEANGRWFWWGAQGPEPYRRLWRLMYERFTGHHALTNLIWVYSPGNATDFAAWYPGDPYVDIIGHDHYPMDGSHAPAQAIFDQINTFGRGKKLLSMAENGPIPEPEGSFAQNAPWLTFVTWSGSMLREHNPPELLRKFYLHPKVINLDTLPNLKGLPAPALGGATKLAFATPPAELAAGFPGRLPLEVEVRDEKGNILRTNGCLVSLSLTSAPREKMPTVNATEDIVTRPTINGIATFSQFHVNQSGRGYVLKASAAGLAPALSQPFEVGPGNGIRREWWTNVSARELEEARRSELLAVAPAGRETLGVTLEIPSAQTNGFLQRLRGSVIPPQTGAYSFQLVCDGVSEFWLCTNSSLGNKVKIAEITHRTPYAKWPHSHEVWSSPIPLEAGQAYALEIVHLQTNGLGHLWAGWRRLDGAVQTPIPGARFTLPETNQNSGGILGQP
jgi:hypothetical protein